MGALNAIAMALNVAKRPADSARSTPPGDAGMRFYVRPGPTNEEWDVSFEHLNATEWAAIRAEFATYGFSGAFGWTSPDDASDEKYRFADGSFEDATFSSADHKISFTLRRAHGVA